MSRFYTILFLLAAMCGAANVAFALTRGQHWLALLWGFAALGFAIATLRRGRVSCKAQRVPLAAARSSSATTGR